MVAELFVILVALAVLALFAAMFFLHQFTVIKRQHEQIVRLTDLLALKAGDPNIVMHIDREMDISRQNQAESNQTMHIRPIT